MPTSRISELIDQSRTEVPATPNSASVVCDQACNILVLRVITYETLISVVLPSKKSSTHKKKVLKTDPITYGPADFMSDRIWTQFLVQLASIVDSLPTLLTLLSLEWRWQKPANSLWVPLQDESGYSSFIWKLRDARGTPSAIFQMDAPVTPPPTVHVISGILSFGFCLSLFDCVLQPWAVSVTKPSRLGDAHILEPDDSDADTQDSRCKHLSCNPIFY